jgi:hypothetical protein
MTEKKPEETPKEKPNRKDFPTEEDEIVVDPNKIPRTKR